jgi:hypothetical protein
MNSIGIVGAGIAGLHLALFLQRHGVEITLYSEHSPVEILAGRLPNLVVRFGPARELERDLGVNFWDDEDFGAYGVQMYIGAQPPIQWKGSFQQQASGVDMRLYQARLMDEFNCRGGHIVVATLGRADVVQRAMQHDLMVVASGRGQLAELFPRLPERSPFSQPQRLLTGAFYHGVNFPNPLSVVYTISPGHGEIFLAPFQSIAGRVCSILIEAIPGQALAPIAEIRYAEDPHHFEQSVLALLREHAPPIYHLVDPETFCVTRPQNILQGAITPTARRGYAPLGNGKFALAIGDAHIVNDPLLGQGANLAARCARLLGTRLLEVNTIDEAFCRAVEQQLWEAGRATTLWTNMMLQPPPPHAIELLVAAAQNQAIADEVADNFSVPERNWKIFGSPEGARRFLEGYSCTLPAGMVSVA